MATVELTRKELEMILNSIQMADLLRGTLQKLIKDAQSDLDGTAKNLGVLDLKTIGSPAEELRAKLEETLLDISVREDTVVW